MKDKFGIATDPGHYLPPEYINKSRVVQVPFYINLGEESIEDRGHLDLERLVRRIDQFISERRGKIATAAPSLGKWLEAFEQLRSSGVRRIVAITLAQKLSASWESASQAAQRFLEDHVGTEIEVVDSQGGTLLEGFAVMDAVEARDQGMSFGEAVVWIKARVPRRRLFATFEDTQYLVASGRLNRYKHLLASILKVKPILTLQGGAAVVSARLRGRTERALERIVDEVSKIPNLSRIAVVEGIAPDLSEKLTELLVARLGIPREKIMQGSVGSTFLVHTGKRAAGVVCESEG